MLWIVNGIKRWFGLFVLLIFISGASSPVMACLCTSGMSSLDEVYSDSTGIYLVTISGISKSEAADGRRINLELTILKAFKGDSLSRLKAVGYGKLPEVNAQGKVIELNTSCDMRYIFGEKYIIAQYDNKEIVLTQCSENVISLEQWAALTKLQLETKQNNGGQPPVKK